jgi:hypothetical protein
LAGPLYPNLSSLARAPWGTRKIDGFGTYNTKSVRLKLRTNPGSLAPTTAVRLEMQGESMRMRPLGLACVALREQYRQPVDA